MTLRGPMRISHPSGHDVAIAGTYYQKTNTRAAFLALGGKREGRGEVAGWATLLPEPTNPYDENAVLVLVEGKKIGYIPAPEAPMYAKWIWENGGIVEVPVRLSRHATQSNIRGDVYLPSLHQLKPPPTTPPSGRRTQTDTPPENRPALPPLPTPEKQVPRAVADSKSTAGGCCGCLSIVLIVLVVLAIIL